MTTVRDLMKRDVVTVTPDTTVLELARLLSDHAISGVPVVEEDGRAVGVVSATDVVRAAAEEVEVRAASSRWIPAPGSRVPEPDPEDDPEEAYGSYFLPEDGPRLAAAWGDQAMDTSLGRMTVEEIMTPVSFSVEPDTTLEEVADFLVRGRIHRAVVQEGGRLAGIVTSSDILRAVAGGALSSAPAAAD